MNYIELKNHIIKFNLFKEFLWRISAQIGCDFLVDNLDVVPVLVRDNCWWSLASQLQGELLHHLKISKREGCIFCWLDLNKNWKINVDQIQKHLKRGGSWGSNGWRLCSLADGKINIQAVKLTLGYLDLLKYSIFSGPMPPAKLFWVKNKLCLIWVQKNEV